MKPKIKKCLSQLMPKSNASPDKFLQSLVRQSEYLVSVLRSQNFDSSSKEVSMIVKKQPSNLVGGKLKKYQLVGLNWIVSLYLNGLNGILADDMGLGKTVQTISFLAYLLQNKGINGLHLILAPKTTLGNWENQFRKWLPEFQIVKLVGKKEEREYALQNYIKNENFNVAISSYEGIKYCFEDLMKINWHCIIIDEAQKIKNEETRISQMIRKLKNKSKLLLTGTPLQNNVHELWSLLNFLMPEIFNDSEAFDSWFNFSHEGKTEEEKEKKNLKLIENFHKILMPYMLRRTKKQVLMHFPPKRQVHIFVGLTTLQLQSYKKVLQTGSLKMKRNFISIMCQLKKVCNHPNLANSTEEIQESFEEFMNKSEKLKILDKLLEKLYMQGNHKVLLFSQMIEMLNIFEDYCHFRSFQYCRIDGRISLEERQTQIQQFMEEDSEKFIFLLSTKAGGLGINLTAADTVVIYDSDWNPQIDLQAMDRAYRIGQTKTVMVYRLITENTVEQKIIERQQMKLKWDNVLIQQSKNSVDSTLTTDQMKNMIKFGASITLKATEGTVTSENIDKILERGEAKTQELNEKLNEKIKKNQNISDLSLSTVNIFDFAYEKEKEDEEALEMIMQKQNQVEEVVIEEELNPREKKRFQLLDIEKKIRVQKIIPEYHFYQEKEKLKALLYKQMVNGKKLTEGQKGLKQALLQTGKRSWTKTDFKNFVNASKQFGKDNIKYISKAVKKSEQETKQYHEVFWRRVDELSQKETIIEEIQSGNETKRKNKELLQWKRKQGNINFNLTIYEKYKSRFTSYEFDRQLLNAVFKFGEHNIQQITQYIRNNTKFKFNLYITNISEGQVVKRIQVINKIIQKQQKHS